MLIGNVGADPEVRYVDQGVAVARVRLATTERGYTLQNGTQVPDHTDWHNVILWRRLAEIVEQYVHKGDKLKTEIWADNIELLSPKMQNNPATETSQYASSSSSVSENPTMVNSNDNTQSSVNGQNASMTSVDNNDAEALPF